MKKKDEILLAASECFSMYGYGKTSMSDIGKRVGLNKASLYYHFKDKRSLYEEVLVKARQEHTIELKKIIEEESTFEGQVIGIVLQEVEFWEQAAISYQLTMQPDEHSETSQVANKLLHQTIELLSNVISNHMEEGFIEKSDPNDTAAMIIQLSQGILLVNCPLGLPLNSKSEGYKHARYMIKKVLKVFVSGLLSAQSE